MMSDINKNPLFSVIVPVYNVEKYLPRCLDSILGQSFQDIEIICINDGSTDTSLDILNEYAARDTRIHIFSQINKGLSAARNTGLNAAHGKWISFVDSDDWVEPDIYSTLAEHCSSDIDAICFGAHEKITVNGKDIIVDDSSYTYKVKGKKTLSTKQMIYLPVNAWNKLFSREKIEKYSLRFQEGVIFEDFPFTFNFFSVCSNVFFEDKILYSYRRRSDSIMAESRNHQEGIAFNYIKGVQNIYNFWTSQGLLATQQKEFETICLRFFRYAIDISPSWEQAGIVYEITTTLRDWNFMPQSKDLLALQKGIISIRIGGFWGKNINMLKPLHGFQKIFYIGKRQGRKILCIFGCKVISWK